MYRISADHFRASATHQQSSVGNFGGVICWSIYAVGHEQLVPEKPFQEWLAHHTVEEGGLSAKLHFITERQLLHTVAEIAGIVFFLLGAMTIVELVDAHEGFSIVTSKIRVRRKSSLLWIVGFVTFFLSAILDNLTTTIVMVSLLRKMISDLRIDCCLWD